MTESKMADGSVVYPVPIQIAVDTLNIHKAPHLDEIATAVVLSLFGESFFPGVRKALEGRKISFKESPAWTRADYIKNRTLPIGIGLGTWFNEHTRDNERIKGWCAFTLATRYLHIDHLPGLRRLQAEVLRCDTQAGCSQTSIAELIKVDMRRQEDHVHQGNGKTVKAGEGMVIFDWAVPVLTAIIMREIQISLNQAMKPGPEERTLMDYFLTWWAEFESEPDKKIDPRIKRSLENTMLLSMHKKDAAATELASAVEAMSRTGMGAEYIKDWCEFTFVAMYLGQVDFFAEVDRQATCTAVEYIRARLNGSECFVMLSVVESDSRYALKAARYLRNKLQEDIPWRKQAYGITLLRSSTGNTQVFADEEIKDCWIQVRPPNRRTLECQGIFEILVRMLRTLEYKSMNAGRGPDFDLLGMHGEGPDGRWYYFYVGGAIMNGTLTKERPPTKIPPKLIKEAVKHSIHPELVNVWIAKHIPFSNR